MVEVGIETADVDVVRRGLRALSLPLDRGMGLQVWGGGWLPVVVGLFVDCLPVWLSVT